MTLTYLERKQNGVTQLLVDDQPFLMRAGELNNSSFSSATYMADVWDRLIDNNLNTVLGSVGWEQIEPVEGEFCFLELDKVIAGARKHGLKIVLLWFGAYKNGLSTYAPSWVKMDSVRFPRARAGQPPRVQDTFSVFNEELVKADEKAFRQLMRHVGAMEEKIVIMVQVENECGLRGDSRDRSEQANRFFHSEVPKDLLSKLAVEWHSLQPSLRKTLDKWASEGFGKSGTWTDLFGDDQRIDEVFMGYHFAKYVDRVTLAGKQEYPIPMFTNVWLPYNQSAPAGGGIAPGIYPSGGPVPAILDIWQLVAPALDFIAPDIYLGDYDQFCHDYGRRDQPLFIPEQRRDEHGALRMWSAIGAHSALGVSPFGIDSDHPSTNPFTSHYALLAKCAPSILSARAEGRHVHGFYFDRYEPGGSDPSSGQSISIAQWNLEITRAQVGGHPGVGYGLVIELSKSFLLFGEGFQVKFTHRSAPFTSILQFVELDLLDGQLIVERYLNGDETSHSTTESVARMPGPDPDYGGSPVAISVPSRTKMAECTPYALME